MDVEDARNWTIRATSFKSVLFARVRFDLLLQLVGQLLNISRMVGEIEWGNQAIVIVNRCARTAHITVVVAEYVGHGAIERTNKRFGRACVPALCAISWINVCIGKTVDHRQHLSNIFRISRFKYFFLGITCGFKKVILFFFAKWAKFYQTKKSW